MDLEAVAALRHLGMADCDDIVASAEDELVRGRRSPALLMLASLDAHARHHEADRLLRRALTELGIEPPEGEAAHDLAVEWARGSIREHARRIVAGEVAPAEGAATISRFFSDFALAPHLEEETIGFVGLWSQWEDDTEGRWRPILEADMVAEAQRLLASPVEDRTTQGRSTSGGSE